MLLQLPRPLGPLSVVLLVCCIFCLASSPSLAQESPADQPAAADQDASEDASAESASPDETESEDTKPDPFKIPSEASVTELFTYMKAVKRIQPPKRDFASVTEHAKKVFGAVIAAADAVMKKSDSDEDLEQALTEKFAAYSILSRYDRSAVADLDALSEKYAEDSRPAIAKIAAGHVLSGKVSRTGKLDHASATEIANDVLAYLERFGLDKSTYATASTIARTLGYSEHTEVAAMLYEQMVPFFQEADDAQLRERADSIMGAARRLRLLGNTMELSGQTAEGTDFDWSAYRGKVVLVDFWASWCGPCIAEIPNMKKNLELYGDRGFEIVGINMDSTRKAFEKCVEDREITWVNLVSEEKGQKGWQAPMATYYGVSAIPTAILVDQEGKVVSLRARGAALDEALAELLGPPSDDESTEE